MPIPFTQPQFLAIANAAAALCPADRDRFVADVAAELAGRLIGDGSIGCAIRVVQARFAHPELEPRTPSRWSRATPRFEKQSRRAG
jgi:hypothetical protein